MKEQKADLENMKIKNEIAIITSLMPEKKSKQREREQASERERERERERDRDRGGEGRLKLNELGGNSDTDKRHNLLSCKFADYSIMDPNWGDRNGPLKLGFTFSFTFISPTLIFIYSFRLIYIYIYMYIYNFFSIYFVLSSRFPRQIILLRLNSKTL